MNDSGGVHRTPASAANVLLVGPVRNCGSGIAREIRHLMRVFSVFASVAVLLVESDSSDDSLHELRKLEREIPNFAFVSMGALAPLHPIRCDRIAQCRNVYVEMVRDDPRYRHIDYVLSADLDGVNDGLTADAVLSSWRTDIDWAGVTANQTLGYYDIWALRHKAWSPVDCWDAYRSLVDTVGPRQALEACVASKQMRIPPEAGLIEVESACGGFAIYKRDAFVCGRYVGKDENGREVNEHIAFHAALRANGHRIYINPAMINADYNEHTRHKTRLGHLRKEFMWTVREAADRLHCRDRLEAMVAACKAAFAGRGALPAKVAGLASAPRAPDHAVGKKRAG